MRIIPEVGDTVFISDYCRRNPQGGTEEVKESLAVKIEKAWEDEEIGWRYVGTHKGQKIYFGQFEVINVVTPV